jgi:hypothetical protein
LHADVRPLTRKLAFVGVFGYLIGGWLVIGGLFAPGLVPGERAPGWVLALAGAFLLLMGWLASSYAQRWYRRASWVVRSVAPTRMRLKVQVRYDAERSRSARALLWPENTGHAMPPPESISVQWPSWDLESLPEEPVEVFRDPKPGGPVVVRTSRGWLWPVPGSVSRS